MSATIERPWGAPVSANDIDRPRCLTCRYYRRRGQQCQRLPPTVIYDINLLQRVTMFPQADDSMWCGEYSGLGDQP